MRTSYGGRRLRQAEQRLIQEALAPVMEEARPHLGALEDLARDMLIPSVPRALGRVAAEVFLEEVGAALWMSGALAGLLREEADEEHQQHWDGTV